MNQRKIKQAAGMLGAVGGSRKSVRKARAARANGKLGGRPRENKR